ncbi:MAG: DNA adenine methylase [Candidatus Lokiarchaeota archaeon]|nr:DNA adenine methylase [Candidatus Lokiarchaeota archaeon]
MVENPHPFLKWAGGKRQLLSQIDLYIPKSFNKYIEPFVGGGALFFYLLPKNAILNDINQDLINTYRVIKENVSELITSLKKHKNEEEYFYKIRSVDRNLDEFKTWSDVEKASRIIYLNRCCYNGLYRVNSKGYFNAPFGKYKNPKICNEENLKLVHKVLKDVKLMNTSFELCLNYAKKDDFIYFDPPYVPISESANFTSYTKSSFKKEDQIKLFNVFKELDQKGCKLLLSNSYNEFILKLYKNYQINIVYAKRAINSNPDKRGEIKELLIINNND